MNKYNSQEQIRKNDLKHFSGFVIGEYNVPRGKLSFNCVRVVWILLLFYHNFKLCICNT